MEKMLFLITVLILLSGAQSVERHTSACKMKEKSQASLSLAKTSLNIVKELYPDCSQNRTFSNVTHCGMKEKSFGYLEIALNLINYAIANYPTCTEKEIDDKKENETKIVDRPMDCSEILKNGHNASGVYSIWLKNGTSDSRRLEVFCDMNTTGGGWTVIQRRGDFPEQPDFFLDWNSYKKGFGNISEVFWLGNENIFALSNQSSYMIRFDLEDANGVKGYAVYQSFKIGDESSNYTLNISNYSGNIGDAMKVHNGKPFLTKDKGHDGSSDGKYCTKNWKGGWWYWNCYEANLNGLYRKGFKSDYSTVNWNPWKGSDCLTASEMKLKRI